MKRILRAIVPGRARAWWRQRFRWRWFRGEYADWAAARRQASAADGAAALSRVCTAARAVRRGDAAWDRDGVTFADAWMHAPLLAALREAAHGQGGRLDLVDFGGGLGSIWWQHRSGLDGIECRSWRVVELPELAAVGTKEFTAAPLSFYSSLEAAFAPGPARVVLLSSVLPYMEDPSGLLRDIVARGFADVIIDRTPVIAGERDRIVVQHTPPELGGGSHPCRLFARRSLLAALAEQYELAAEWPVPFDQVDPAVDYRGFHFRRRSPLTQP